MLKNRSDIELAQGAGAKKREKTPKAILQGCPEHTNLLTTMGDIFACLSFRARNVPTLSEYGLIAMAVVMGFIGYILLRRKKATA